MTKSELIDKIAEVSELSKKDSKIFYKALEEVIESTVATEEISLGFGKLEVIQRKERNGVNPKTQEPMVIPAKLAPKFKASAGLKRIVAGE